MIMIFKRVNKRNYFSQKLLEYIKLQIDNFHFKHVNNILRLKNRKHQYYKVIENIWGGIYK